MDECKVSVIIPFYNVEPYFRDCLDSLARQSFTEYELILVDDGSTDHSRQIAEEYARQDPRIQIIVKENEGQGKARNQGLEAARGKYIYFLDSNDYIADHTLGTLYEEAERWGTDLLLFNGSAFCEKGIEEDPNIQGEMAYYHRKGNYPHECCSGAQALLLLRKQEEYSCSVCLQFVRRELFLQYEISFPEGIIHEDEYYAFLIFMYSARVKFLPDTLFFRRYHKESTMTGDRGQKSFYGYARTCEWISAWEEEHTLSPLQRQCARQHALMFFQAALYRFYFRLPKERRKEIEESMNSLLTLARKKKGWGDGEVFLVSCFWKPYRWVRLHRKRKA